MAIIKHRKLMCLNSLKYKTLISQNVQKSNNFYCLLYVRILVVLYIFIIGLIYLLHLYIMYKCTIFFYTLYTFDWNCTV